MGKIVWCFLLAGVLMGCSQGGIGKTEKNTIGEAKLDEREMNLLRAAAGDMLFFYDVAVGAQGKSMEVWWEKYEYGKLIETKIGEFGSEFFGERQILIKIEGIPEQEQALMRSAIVSESSYSVNNSTVELSREGLASWGPLVPAGTTIAEEMVLGQIVYAEESIFKSSWPDLHSDPEALVNELKEFPMFYLLRATFKDLEKE